MKVVFTGTPSKYFTAKDAILALINKIGIQGGTGYAIEFCGDYIKKLSMEGRMTISNMTIECGAKYGLISPDEKTFDYIRGTKFAPKNFDKAIEKWKCLASSDEAKYDITIKIDIEGKNPYVTWGTNPEQSVEITEKVPDPSDFSDPAKALAAKKALEYIQLKPGDKINGLPVTYVFIGSCTNGRIEDLREAAKIMKGKQCAKGVRVCIVPGSEKVKAQAIKEGLDKIFLASGAEFREPGCSFCLAMNGDVVPAGERCASTSNRNFVGRQGPGSFTHLMSPIMAGITAIEGKIMTPEEYFKTKNNG
jgi:3-isopropylmalate/(R)-2-methylmalate dehydratase large subunit